MSAGEHLSYLALIPAIEVLFYSFYLTVVEGRESDSFNLLLKLNRVNYTAGSDGVKKNLLAFFSDCRCAARIIKWLLP